MAQQQKAQKQADPYVQRGKALASAVQRLRGWVGSDPARTPELADALVDLTTHRLLGHAHITAVGDAQEAVKYAAQLLTANGPIGPYTSTTDAARYITAVVQLAIIQVGVGLPDSAGRTMASVDDMAKQLGEAGVELQLSSPAAVWALSGSARVALAAGDVPAANAYADAALARSIESGLLDDPGSIYLAVDVERLVSDARWAAGRAEPALGYLLSAKNRFDAFAVDRLREPGRVGPPVLERLAEPLFGLYSDAADRLIASGESALGLTVRRALIDLLQGLVGRLGEATQLDLEAAQAELAADLVAERTRRPPLSPGATSWEPLPPSASYATTSPSVDLLALDLERRRAAAAWLDRERPGAQRLEDERRDLALAEVERRDAEQRAEERAAADRLAAERAAADEAALRETQRLAAAEEAERLERKRRREERLEAHRLEVEQRRAAQREAERLEIERREAERRQADPAEMERLELERLQADLAELDRAEAERREAERLEAEQAEAEQRGGASGGGAPSGGASGGGAPRGGASGGGAPSGGASGGGAPRGGARSGASGGGAPKRGASGSGAARGGASGSRAPKRGASGGGAPRGGAAGGAPSGGAPGSGAPGSRTPGVRAAARGEPRNRARGTPGSLADMG